MKRIGTLGFFAFVGIFVMGIPAALRWFTSGQWPKDEWIAVLIFMATCAVASILEQLQIIYSAIVEIKEQGAEIKEKLEQVEESIGEIDRRFLRSTKSALDEY